MDEDLATEIDERISSKRQGCPHAGGCGSYSGIESFSAFETYWANCDKTCTDGISMYNELL